MSANDSVAGLVPRQIWDGLVARPLHGAGITVGILEFEPMTQVAESRQRAIGTRPQGVDHNGHRRRTSRLQVGGMYSIGSGVPDSWGSRAGRRDGPGRVFTSAIWLERHPTHGRRWGPLAL